MRSQLASVMSPQATRETLSYELTEQELTLFDQNLQTQQRVFTGIVDQNGAVRIRGTGPNGPPPGRRAVEVRINSSNGNATVREFFIEQPATNN